MLIDIALCEDTELSRFLSLDNVVPSISLIYDPLTLFTALLAMLLGICKANEDAWSFSFRHSLLPSQSTCPVIAKAR